MANGQLLEFNDYKTIVDITQGKTYLVATTIDGEIPEAITLTQIVEELLANLRKQQDTLFSKGSVISSKMIDQRSATLAVVVRKETEYIIPGKGGGTMIDEALYMLRTGTGKIRGKLVKYAHGDMPQGKEGIGHKSFEIAAVTGNTCSYEETSFNDFLEGAHKGGGTYLFEE